MLTNEYHALIASGALNQRSAELLEGLIVEIAPEGNRHQFCQELTVGTISPIKFPDLEVAVDLWLGN